MFPSLVRDQKSSIELINRPIVSFEAILGFLNLEYSVRLSLFGQFKIRC